MPDYMDQVRDNEAWVQEHTPPPPSTTKTFTVAHGEPASPEYLRLECTASDLGDQLTEHGIDAAYVDYGRACWDTRVGKVVTFGNSPALEKLARERHESTIPYPQS